VRFYIAARRDDAEALFRRVVGKLIDAVFIGDRLYHGPKILRRIAWRALPYAGGWAYSPRATDLRDRIAARTCEHRWHYDAEESAGPWTGYIERCVKCNALQQVPQ
jgi:hypothetical protein